jgi:hypothetical protein
MIRRAPTEIPLRQEDVADFVARMQEKKLANTTNPQPTGSNGKQTQTAEKGTSTNQAVNMVEVNREARAGMTRESRIGI